MRNLINIIEGVGGYTPDGRGMPRPFGSKDVLEEPGYLYHGTAKVRLPAIRRDGLVPATKSRFARDPFIGEWSIGKVFFTTNVEKAKFYALEASKPQPVLLRVPASAVEGSEDDRDTDSVYVDTTVPASAIEYWTGRVWKAC